MLLDSNIIIYAAQPEHAQLRQFVSDHAPAVSAVSYVEVLGYHQLNEGERQYLEKFFRLARVLPISQAVLDEAVALRQQRRMSLGEKYSVKSLGVFGSYVRRRTYRPAWSTPAG